MAPILRVAWCGTTGRVTLLRDRGFIPTLDKLYLFAGFKTWIDQLEVEVSKPKMDSKGLLVRVARRLPSSTRWSAGSQAPKQHWRAPGRRPRILRAAAGWPRAVSPQNAAHRRHDASSKAL
jgi:hypothetical protein